MTSTIPTLTRLQIPLEEVVKATNNFDEEYVIGGGGFGKVYRGQLSVSGEMVNIAARRLDPKHRGGGVEFWTEISVLSSLKHENMLSLVGFCDENGEKIIINKDEATKGSLSMYLSDPTTLTWIQRLKICLGVARALRYIQNSEGRGFSVIHRNINSYTILLDAKFEAKLSGFEYSIKQSVDRSERVVLLEAIGTKGYMDPSIVKTGGVSHKSDIYSFGVVLCEILCARKAFIPDADADNRFLAPLFRSHYENGSLNDIIHPDLRLQMSRQSLSRLSTTAYSCLKQDRVQRPKINDIVIELEKVFELQQPPENLIKKLEHLRIPMRDIMLATDNFSEAYHMGHEDFVDLYIAELEHIDKGNPSIIEGMNKSELPRRRSKVLIKRIFPKEDYEIGEEMFYTEIKMLDTCKHPNIVELLGFSDEGSEMIIVVELLSRGLLVRYWMMSGMSQVLTWAKRLKICLDVAKALNYLHTEMEDQKRIIHRDIKSVNIALDENWGPKIIDFRRSVFLPPNQDDDALIHTTLFGTRNYMDPEYRDTGKLKRESDVYNFGVVLFEALCGRSAYDPIYLKDGEQGLAIMARRCFQDGTLLTEMIDPILNKKERCEDNFIQKGPNKYSLERFVKIAHECIAKTQNRRPTMKVVIRELQKALFFEEEAHLDTVNNADEVEELSELNLTHEDSDKAQWPGMVQDVVGIKISMDLKLKNGLKLENLVKKLEHLKIPLCDIMLATHNFSKGYITGGDEYYYLYTVKLEHFDTEIPSIKKGKNKSDMYRTRNTVVIKRYLPREYDTAEAIFFTEFKILDACKHPSIVKILGFCVEDSEMILVIEHLPNGYLEDYWKNPDMRPYLSWEKRLKICLDVANALNYLHTEMEDQITIIHRDIKSYYIALGKNWGAKIVDFQMSLFMNQDDDTLYHNYYVGTREYIDPEYRTTGKLKRESDVYGFGVVLFEVLCGRLAYDPKYLQESEDGLAFVARRCFQEGTVMDMIDPILKKESSENSFSLNRGPNKDSLEIFVNIAHESIAENQDQRPTMKVVIEELQKALFCQEEKHLDVADEVEESMELKLTRENSIKNLEISKIPLSYIVLATERFSMAYRIKPTSYKYLEFYRAEVKHFDTQNPSIKEEDNISDMCRTVVIKRFCPRNHIEKEMFYTEIKVLAICKHPRIIKLLGYCVEGSEMIIVVENLSNGNLYDYWKNTGLRHTLTWEKRLKICLDVANALNYLHTEMEDQKTIIHRGIMSYNIELDENWGAKLIGFHESVFLPPNQDTLYDSFRSGVRRYWDPEYWETRKLKRESDVYSFGVVLFEVLCGRLAYDPIYTKESDDFGLAFVARRCFREGTLTEIIDPILKEQRGKNSFILNRGPNKDSLEKFVKIAHRCIATTQDKRPTMKVVIQELQDALFFQENNKDEPIISLEVIRLATRNFHHDNCIGGGGFGKVFKGEVPQGDGFNTIVAKRLDTRLGQGAQQFRNEIQILFEYKHENIISLVGYCDEKNEQIIVYEYASQGSLDRYLKDARLTWMKRLNICIDVATALAFLHGGAGKQAIVIHRDIKTGNILLNDEWDAKLADFGLSLISPINQETDYVVDHVCGTRGYLDPLYLKSGFLTKESDIYSFGVVLFEILCGRSTFEIHKDKGMYLPGFIKESFKKGKGKHDDLVFEALKEQIVPKALTAFQTIAYQCLHDDREKRPTAKEVLQQLKEAREFQRQAMRDHDEALQKLNGTEISTKPIALAVNEEPDLHTNILIDDLDEHVEVKHDLVGFRGCFEAIIQFFFQLFNGSYDAHRGVVGYVTTCSFGFPVILFWGFRFSDVLPVASSCALACCIGSPASPYLGFPVSPLLLLLLLRRLVVFRRSLSGLLVNCICCSATAGCFPASSFWVSG
uniref:uncharacterized protein LOC122583749 n=1 Tax=Erigeron canadensis TaxID=72917 RepID=UPI001CB99595|nr:uncharacterized protein LOC122583749 [Erigeron canadensis]